MRRWTSSARLKNKKVLLIAYYFPPVGGPGVMRPLKLAKYLGCYGWKPTILSVREFVYHLYDPSNLKEVNFPVHRSESLDPARILHRLGRRRSEGGVVNWWRKLLNIPDTRGGWLIPGIHYGLKIAKDCRAIIATAPPFTVFLIGLILARTCQIPLICDFRDFWVEFPYLPYYSWQKPIIRFLQDLILKKSSWVTVAFDEIKGSFPKRYHKKTTVIYNGFDPEDFAPVEKPDVFTISLMGSITPRRKVEPLIPALAGLNLKVRLIGYIHPDEQKKIRNLEHIETTGYLAHHEALKRLQSSHLLILLNSPLDSPAPGRQAEYAATRLPILVVGHTGSCPVLKRLKESGYPVTFVDYDDTRTLRHKIQEYLHRWRKGEIPQFKGSIDFLDRKYQAGIFSEILDRCLVMERADEG